MKIVKPTISPLKLQGESDWWNTLSDEQKNSIERGLKDLKKGRVKPSREVWKKFGRE